jgi:tRNA dimethylallyltransferase
MALPIQNNQQNRPRVIAIVGPTGIGKSSLAQELALSLNTSVLSADSMQIYRGMDIGTAKLPISERKVPHFGLDLIEPAQTYSAADYQAYGRKLIDSAGSSSPEAGRQVAPLSVPVVCGGTGLYLRALLDDFNFAGFTEEEQKEQLERRQKYEGLWEEIGAQGLHDLLAERDLAAAREIHPNNARRTVRALELWEAGESYAQIKKGFKSRVSYYPSLWIGLSCDRASLYQGINARVDKMMTSGLLEEVEGLLAAGYRSALTAQQAIGYKELVPVIEQGADLNLAVDAIKQATRRYAKRQLSWFRGDQRIEWIQSDGLTTAEIFKKAQRLISDYNWVNREEEE